eukprot:2546435-Pyramimonas_sp.AAC.1
MAEAMARAGCSANTAALKAAVAAAKVAINVWKFNATDDRWAGAVHRSHGENGAEEAPAGV